MAFFGFFNFDKEGPGIAKDAPKKRTFIVFFETFFRNFWKFITISLVYSAISLPQVTSGLAAAGMTNVARNTARDKHSFGLSDFFETIKKNWKQALPAGIINTLIYAVLIFDAWFFYNSDGIMARIGLGITFAMLFTFTIMNYFLWTLMITFKFTLKQIYKNSFKFVFINMKSNLICFFSQVLVLGIYVGMLFLLSKWFLLVLAVEIIFFAMTFPSFKYLLVQYCIFPSIKKYIIDPYYEAHPDEDLDKRRDLGVYTPEKTVIENEDGEEESENVFND